VGLEVATARAFAARSLTTLPVGAEEGAVSRRSAVLEEARRAGLLTEGTDAAAAEGAVWGEALGDELSVAVLVELARASAGEGQLVSSSALAARLARDLGLAADAGAIVAAPIAPRCPPLSVLDDPSAESGTWLPEVLLPSPAGRGVGGEGRGPRGGERSGAGGEGVSFPYVWGVPAPTALVLAFVRAEGVWAVAQARIGDAGVQVREDDRPRLGLRACPLVSVAFARVEAAMLAVRGDGARAVLHAHLRRLWLGLAALAVGTAEGAVAEAARYANDRVQGGGPIARHAAVQTLLGEAATRAAAARAVVTGASATPGLPSAAAARLSATTDAALAVTSALQVLGGNGYMEDFPLARRLRDVEALRVTQGTPDDLRRIVAAATSRGAS